MGATLGYSYGRELDTLMETMTVRRVASDHMNYKKLMAGRIDIFPCNEIVARGLFKQHPELRGKFSHSNRSFIQWVLRMGISKQSDFVRIIPGIDMALAKMEETGTIHDIVRKYTE